MYVIGYANFTYQILVSTMGFTLLAHENHINELAQQVHEELEACVATDGLLVLGSENCVRISSSWEPSLVQRMQPFLSLPAGYLPGFRGCVIITVLRGGFQCFICNCIRAIAQLLSPLGPWRLLSKWIPT